ncbi:unnamed protein product [Acanthosepion pharaonis]|uniref:Uncharacterized protein n=1 Tax=Acanthosepion pharaonis TaxID=158019 RepID=A0A812E757_ACAPH|nr:unnamed protein product [Sepia pharaonis]
MTERPSLWKRLGKRRALKRGVIESVRLSLSLSLSSVNATSDKSLRHFFFFQPKQLTEWKKIKLYNSFSPLFSSSFSLNIPPPTLCLSLPLPLSLALLFFLPLFSPSPLSITHTHSNVPSLLRFLLPPVSHSHLHPLSLTLKPPPTFPLSLSNCPLTFNIFLTTSFPFSPSPTVHLPLLFSPVALFHHPPMFTILQPPLFPTSPSPPKSSEAARVPPDFYDQIKKHFHNLYLYFIYLHLSI